VDLRIASEPADGSVAVRVSLRLTPRELNRIFLTDDPLIQLPCEGLVAEDGPAPMERPSIFLSELAERRDGYARLFADQASADRYAAAVRAQLEAAMAALDEP
jgi:hypothetical protein